MPQFVYLVDCEINRMQKLEKFLLLRCQRVIKFLWQIVLGKEWGTKIILGKARRQWELGRKRKKRRKNNKTTTWSDKNPFPIFFIQSYAVNIENISCLFLCIMWHIYKLPADYLFYFSNLLVIGYFYKNRWLTSSPIFHLDLPYVSSVTQFKSMEYLKDHKRGAKHNNYLKFGDFLEEHGRGTKPEE